MSGPVFPPLLTDQEILLGLRAGGAQVGGVPRPLDQGRPGEQLSRRQGSGMDFAETRHYAPGDDPRHIDWRASLRTAGRGGGLLSRTYHEEVARPLGLLIDRRASMCFGTRRRLKVTQALRVALAVAAPALARGQEIGGVVLEDPAQETGDSRCYWQPPRTGLTPVLDFMRQAARPCPPPSAAQLASPHALSWSRVLAGLRAQLPRGSSLLLVSDFLGLDEDASLALRTLAAHCRLQAVRIEDPLERSLPRSGGQVLSWGTQRVLLEGAGAGEEQMAQHRDRVEALEQAFSRAGVPSMTLAADADDLDLAGVIL